MSDKEAGSAAVSVVAKPRCDCGNAAASWRGDTLRVYCCDRCWRVMLGAWPSLYSMQASS
jgi:endogenous inhibitor of DNA gyrase (YacG/DUF329 family)